MDYTTPNLLQRPSRRLTSREILNYYSHPVGGASPNVLVRAGKVF